MEKYLEFREKYKTFTYEGYQYFIEDGLLKVVYDFDIDGLDHFSPYWKFDMGKRNIDELMIDETFDNMVFSLGMVELISYWKICCPKEVIIKGRFLNDEQIKWWKELYYLGLGEYFYTNHIETSVEEFMTIVPEGEKKYVVDDNVKKINEEMFEGCLVPIGGGKDSVVSLELLKKTNNRIRPFIINPRGATLNTVSVGGFDDELITAKRILDKNMIRLNGEGFLNGHTPYSAIVAFSTTIVAYLNKLRYITLSNEASANESTVKGSDVNHQYSKSFKFEKDFHHYEEKYLGSGTMYFSLLRPLSEFQIARFFAKQKQYHDIFRSCNVGSKEDIWCGHCSKCLFVYLILSPFLSDEELVKIFGVRMTDDQNMQEDFEKLIGMVEEKPFECVGSREEVNAAVTMTIRDMESKGMKLPYLFEYYKTTHLYNENKDREYTFFSEYNDENLLPEQFAKLVRENAVEA